MFSCSAALTASRFESLGLELELGLRLRLYENVLHLQHYTRALRLFMPGGLGGLWLVEKQLQ